MEKHKIKINGETILKGILSVVFIVFFYFLLSWIGFSSDVLSPWKQAVDSYRLSDLYFSWHRGKSYVTDDGISVVLVDISSCTDRNEVAEVIDRINQARPRVIALDVIFPQAVAVDNAQNDSLVNVLKRVSNLVVATEVRPKSDTGYTRISSFFAGSVEADEGLVTLPSGVIRTWNPLMVVGNDTIPSFTKVIADKAGKCMPDTYRSQMIDYSIQDDVVLDAAEQWDNRFLEGQIVIVGDLKDVRDTYVIPVTLKTSVRQSGVAIHRQILLTCLGGVKIKTSPRWLVIMFSAILLFVVSQLIFPMLDWADTREKELKENNDKITLRLYFKGSIYRHISALVQVGLMLLTAVIGYIMFWTTGYYFEAEFLLMGYALLYMSHNFTDAIVDFAHLVFGKDKKE